MHLPSKKRIHQSSHIVKLVQADHGIGIEIQPDRRPISQGKVKGCLHLFSARTGWNFSHSFRMGFHIASDISKDLRAVRDDAVQAAEGALPEHPDPFLLTGVQTGIAGPALSRGKDPGHLCLQLPPLALQLCLFRLNCIGADDHAVGTAIRLHCLQRSFQLCLLAGRKLSGIVDALVL